MQRVLFNVEDVQLKMDFIFDTFALTFTKLVLLSSVSHLGLSLS